MSKHEDISEGIRRLYKAALDDWAFGPKIPGETIGQAANRLIKSAGIDVLRSDATVVWQGVRLHFEPDVSAEQALRTLYDSGVVSGAQRKKKPRLFDKDGNELKRLEALGARVLLLRPTIFP